MIATMLIGGLGNQMFQYAAGRALALRHGTELTLDLSWFEKEGHGINRSFELDKLQIEGVRPQSSNAIRLMLARRPAKVFQAISGWNVARERSLAYDPAFERMPDQTYLIGYWQSWRYLEAVAQQVWTELQPGLPLSSTSNRMKDAMLRGASVSLHIRRGDYVSAPQTSEFHGVLDLEFYRCAIDALQKRYDGLKFFLFSDDLDWCRAQFEPLKLDLTYMDFNRGADSWQDLYLMASCRHSIVANSSFSWWGAWLADHAPDRDNRQVIAPRRWFAGADVPVEDRCPPSWLCL